MALLRLPPLLVALGPPPPTPTRPEAGGLPDAALLRTWSALRKSLAHLRGLMGRVSSSSSSSQGVSLLEAHRFLWDRYRSMRKDITQTELAHKVGGGGEGEEAGCRRPGFKV